MLENPLSKHILPNAATMVGVCLTGIGLVKIIEQHTGPSHVDTFLALDSVLFCVSSLFSYFSLRWAGRRRAQRYETLADYAFMSGMIIMVVVSIIFAFDLA